MNFVLNWLLLIRVWNALFAAMVCIYSFFIAKNSFALNCNEFSLCLGVFFMVAFANSHNDIIDSEIDKINRPNRPLPSGNISLRTAYIATFLCFFFAMLLGVLAGQKFGLFFLAITALSFIYNRFLKGLPLAGNFMVAMLTCSPIIIPIMNFGLPQPELANLAFFAFTLTFAREITKDIEDIAGDKTIGLKTFPILFGVNYSLSIVFIFESLCLIKLAIFNPFLLVGVLPCLVISAAFAILKKWRLSQTMIKIAMIAGMGFIFIY